ncbi:MAG TPA: hypothetical protein VKJ47_05480, partial [Candidatus Binatia bacterium]|nr:hypothetical protein [Candidatus Binatia bacterium]
LVAVLIAVYLILTQVIKYRERRQRDEDRKAIQEQYATYLTNHPVMQTTDLSKLPASARDLTDSFRAGPEVATKENLAANKAFTFEMPISRGPAGSAVYWVVVYKNGQEDFILVPLLYHPDQEGEPPFQDFEEWKKGWASRHQVKYHTKD